MSTDTGSALGRLGAEVLRWQGLLLPVGRPPAMAARAPPGLRVHHRSASDRRVSLVLAFATGLAFRGTQ